MKICLVTAFPPSRDALNEYGYHIASELQQLPGVELRILADEYSPAQTELDGFSVVRCWKFNSIKNPASVLKTIWRERPDVVWFNLGFASFGGSPLPAFMGIAIPAFARLSGAYTHVTLHQLMETVDLSDAGVRFPLAYKVGGFIATQLVLFANSVSVMLPAYRNVLVEKYGRGAVYVRRHGIFSSRPDYPDFAQRGNPHHRILAFGKWGTYKRLEPLLEAFKTVVQHCPEARLVVAGTDHPKTPGYLASVQEQYSEYKEISFIGYVAEEEIAPLLQRSTVAVLPYTSSAGSSGIAHLACTYGVPIIASDLPDFRRLADEEGLAIDFFPCGDNEALAAHLI
ncbi:MAG TPA: glycosyltransferase, partial [Terriglobales bacterium]